MRHYLKYNSKRREEQKDREYLLRTFGRFVGGGRDGMPKTSVVFLNAEPEKMQSENNTTLIFNIHFSLL